MAKSGLKMTWLTRLITITVLSGFMWSCTIKTTQRGIGAPDPIKIQDIRVAEGVDKTIIELESEEPILYTSFRLSDPDRLVIEMADVTFGQYQDEIKVSSGPVRSIMLASSGELDVSRLEFELSGLVKTEVRPDGLNIVVEVTRLEKMTGLGKTPQVEAMHKKSFIFFGDGEKKGDGEIKAAEPPLMNLDAKRNPVLLREESIAASPKGGASSLPSLAIPSTPPLPLVKVEAPRPTEKMEKEAEPSPPEMVVETKKIKSTSPAKLVTGLRFVEGKSLQLVVSSDGRLSPNIFFVGKNKNRLVIDFPGVTTNIKRDKIMGDTFYVKQVRIGRHPNKLRLVLDLNQRVVFAWAQKQTELWVTIK